MTRVASRASLLPILFGLAFAPTALGQECPARNIIPSRPVLLTTDAQLQRACDRVNNKQAPFYTAWRYTIGGADAAFNQPLSAACETRKWDDPTRVDADYFKVYCGQNHVTFARHLLRQGVYARYLALAFQITGQARYADLAIQILDNWARQGARYPQSGSDECGYTADSCFLGTGLVLGEAAVIFGDVYAMTYEAMSAAERSRILGMLSSYRSYILESRRVWIANNYFWRQNYNNHLSSHNLGLISVGYLTGDVALKNYAISGASNPRNLRVMINGAIYQSGDRLDERDPSIKGGPQPVQGESYDRYRTVQGKGFNYASLHFRFLALAVEIIIANGQTNYWNYVAPGGEQLFWYYKPYNKILSTGDLSAGTGYYANDTSLATNTMSLFELGAARYPSNKDILESLVSRPRVTWDPWFGRSLTLTHGAAAYAPMWAFNLAGRFQGWKMRNLTGVVEDGKLKLTVTGADPQLQSPKLLYIPAVAIDEVRVVMKNATSDTLAQLFFATNQPGEGSFTSDKKFSTSLIANDTGFRTYIFKVAGHAKWTGNIRRIRLDPVNAASSGKVEIDAIHFYKNGVAVNR